MRSSERLALVMRRPHVAAAIVALSWPHMATACGRCAPLVRVDVFNADFPAQLCLLLAPLAVIGALAWVIAKIDLFN